jgi:hypothetical protein
MKTIKYFACILLFILTSRISAQEIIISKESLFLSLDSTSFYSEDSLIIYNTGNFTLTVDTIFSTNASGFLLDIVLKDTIIQSAVTWRNNFYNPFELASGDSAYLLFKYPLWVPEISKISEIWADTIIILNNSINNPFLSIPTTIDFPIDVDDELSVFPGDYYLFQNYPNPFNPSTKIKFQIPSITLLQSQSDNLVTLKVYDVLGNEIATLVNEEKQPGIYEVEFSLNSDGGRNLSSGIYFYQLKSGNFVETKKMLLLK